MRIFEIQTTISDKTDHSICCCLFITTVTINIYVIMIMTMVKRDINVTHFPCTYTTIETYYTTLMISSQIILSYSIMLNTNYESLLTSSNLFCLVAQPIACCHLWGKVYSFCILQSCSLSWPLPVYWSGWLGGTHTIQCQ